MIRKLLPGLLLLGLAIRGRAETWESALARMPLPPAENRLDRTNCAKVILAGFQSNVTVKALIFMPGATDELYFFRRVNVIITNSSPSLLEAIVALTNQSPVRVTFRAPFLLLHTPEDFLDPEITVKHEGTRTKLQAAKPLPQVLANDRDWTHLVRQIKKKIPATLLPYERTLGSWHFYRHTFAGWNLTPWETMEAAALAGKTRFTVVRRGVIFEVDSRVGPAPQLEKFPGH
jgi:hypothetical protein